MKVSIIFTVDNPETTTADDVYEQGLEVVQYSGDFPNNWTFDGVEVS